MRILREEENWVLILPETDNDLYHLSKVIREGDIVRARTIRKVKLSETANERKSMTIALIVERMKLEQDIPNLRVSGKIQEADDPNVQLQSYHSIDLEPRTKLDLFKKTWNRIDILRIRRAIDESGMILFHSILIDDSNALYAEIRPNGYNIRVEFSSNANKRGDDYEKTHSKYMERIVNYLVNSKIGKGMLVIAGPGFAKEELKEKLDGKGGFTTALETIGYANETGLHELLGSERVKFLLKDSWISEQEKNLNAFIEHASKDKKDVTYGIEGVKKAIEFKAVSRIMVHEELLQKEEIRELVDSAMALKAEVVIFSSDSEPGERFRSFGLAAFLKFAID